MKNAFYFILKVFVMPFWPFRKNSLIRNIKLISEFMISQPGQQTIAIHIFPNISRCKDNLKWNLRAERVEISTRYTAFKKITIIWKISTWVEIWYLQVNRKFLPQILYSLLNTRISSLYLFLFCIYFHLVFP